MCSSPASPPAHETTVPLKSTSPSHLTRSAPSWPSGNLSATTANVLGKSRHSSSRAFAKSGDSKASKTQFVAPRLAPRTALRTTSRSASGTTSTTRTRSQSLTVLFSSATSACVSLCVTLPPRLKPNFENPAQSPRCTRVDSNKTSPPLTLAKSLDEASPSELRASSWPTRPVMPSGEKRSHPGWNPQPSSRTEKCSASPIWPTKSKCTQVACLAAFSRRVWTTWFKTYTSVSTSKSTLPSPAADQVKCAFEACDARAVCASKTSDKRKRSLQRTNLLRSTR
ncbi:hypothetical protein M885DRAFT_546253 [Pelagophyceae sp. CCMP2097]|nr:hypothetical protein M885DRAFT_546253 [Pelagophyceae sp. CCMP2097]|mmetsp:Transcript_2917/g.10459  ORF Transcript_2917/g.10459 Transcript_2917/m.10459 type:complete len:282 (+) Transcript_2917:317-1162(+)